MMQQTGAEAQRALQPLDRAPCLEELVDAAVLGDFLSSCHSLFSMPLRVISSSGRLVARAGDEPALHEYVGTSEAGSERLGALYAKLREIDLLAQPEVVVPAFSGARYHVQAVGHQGSLLGRIVLGPFRALAPVECDERSLAAELDLDAEQLKSRLVALPALNATTLEAIAHHMGAALRLMLYLSHKSLVATEAQLAVAQDLERRLQHQLELGREERRAYGFRRQEQSGLLLRLSKQLQDAVRRLQARVGSDLEGAALRESVVKKVSSGLERSRLEVEEALRELQSAPLERMSVAPRDLVTSLREQLEQHAQRRAVLLTFHVEPGLPRLRCDEASLLTALRALALGILECTPAGSPYSVVVAGARQADSTSTGELLFDASRSRTMEIHMRGGDPQHPGALAACLRAALGTAPADALLLERQGGESWRSESLRTGSRLAESPRSEGDRGVASPRWSLSAELGMAREIIERHGGSARFECVAEAGEGELVIELPSQ